MTTWLVDHLAVAGMGLRGTKVCSKVILIYTKVKTKDCTCSHFVPTAISKKVFKISVAPFLPVSVKLVKNSHFYNVNLALNFKRAITFFWDVRIS